MLLLLILHAVVAAAVVPVVRRRGADGFLLAAVPPLAAAAWLAWQLPGVLAGRDVTEAVAWVPGWGLEVALRLDALAAAMVVLVAGVGMLVAVYARAYFAGDRPARTAAALVAFTGAMLGLVLADDLLLLYVFWELTTVSSFLLIGHDDTEAGARRKATQALLTTTAGGLAMLLGFVVLGETAGTYSISGIVASPPGGGAVAGALVLVLFGAFAKSAQVPFHGWLPAAMVAPTPVSAYLHAAAMVNAGIYLVARLAPAFAEVPLWQPVVLTAGVLTLLLGGWRALRQTDLKRLLAFSTVSQLGFLMVLLGEGGRTAALAGVALLLAHGLAKAGLFFVAGAVDHETGTRDLRELGGLGRRAPGLAALTVVSAASLAGVPALLGWAAKESAYEAFAHGGPGDAVVLAGLVVGSVFTVAYSSRLVLAVFAGPLSGSAARMPATPWGFAGPIVPLAAGSLLLGLWTVPVDALAATWADRFPVRPGGDPEHHVELWHGFGLPLALSALTLTLGVGLYLARRPAGSVQDRIGAALPAALDVDHGYEAVLTAVRRLARRVTVTIQAGSPPVYLLLIGATVLVLPGSALVAALLGGSAAGLATPVPWNGLPEAVVGALVLAAAVAVALIRRRLAIVLMLGFVGYGVAGLFVLRLAPDLALTQLLVETLTLVAFVLVLRRLPEMHDDPRPSTRRRAARVVVAGGLGVLVGGLGLVAATSRTRPGVGATVLAVAESEAHAPNAVAAILVDIRGLDTVGEMSVLLVAIVGVASLVLVSRRTTGGVAERPPPADEGMSPMEQEVSR
ncbi:MAG TPA: hydrogen gas-evolving membrane-bound hydrogenase subunit E [Pseudonocardia sp.]|nr:hydrogen gas-evolving membrane-bound hydrogenase subunit E [Pseudonocardia sp.]